MRPRTVTGLYFGTKPKSKPWSITGHNERVAAEKAAKAAEAAVWVEGVKQRRAGK